MENKSKREHILWAAANKYPVGVPFQLRDIYRKFQELNAEDREEKIDDGYKYVAEYNLRAAWNKLIKTGLIVESGPDMNHVNATWYTNKRQENQFDKRTKTYRVTDSRDIVKIRIAAAKAVKVKIEPKNISYRLCSGDYIQSSYQTIWLDSWEWKNHGSSGIRAVNVFLDDKKIGCAVYRMGGFPLVTKRNHWRGVEKKTREFAFLGIFGWEVSDSNPYNGVIAKFKSFEALDKSLRAGKIAKKV
jgi:hypothetical protein